MNDRLDVALATGADGVHVGRDDLPPAEIRRLAGPEVVVGASAHDRRELVEAQESGASYAGLGAFFPSRTKPEAILLDVRRAGLEYPVEGLAIPVVAIGGITAERVRDAFRVPAVTGIAVSEAVQGSDDPAEAVTRLRAAVDRTWKERVEDAGQEN